MGKDGAEGMLEMRNAGAITLGQDEASSLIYGMPRAAFERGAVAHQHSLHTWPTPSWTPATVTAKRTRTARRRAGRGR